DMAPDQEDRQEPPLANVPRREEGEERQPSDLDDRVGDERQVDEELLERPEERGEQVRQDPEEESRRENAQERSESQLLPSQLAFPARPPARWPGLPHALVFFPALLPPATSSVRGGGVGSFPPVHPS